MRIFFLFIVTIAGLVMTFFDAFYGVMLYVFYAIVSPLDLLWWERGLGYFQLSFLVAAAVIISAIVQRRSLAVRNPTVYLSVIFMGVCYMSLIVNGSSSEPAWQGAWLLARIIIMATVIAALTDDYKKIKYLFIAIAAFVGLLGAYYGYFGLMSGSMYITGPGAAEGGRFGDNNGYAVWLNTSLPIIFCAGSYLRSRWQRIAARVIFLGNVIAVVLTFSRAGFLTLVLVLSTLAVYAKKKSFSIILMLVALGVIYFGFIGNQGQYGAPIEYYSEQSSEGLSGPQKILRLYHERVQTIEEFKQEASAVSRMYYWQVALDMANNNPLFGVGFSRYSEVFDSYDWTGGVYGKHRAVHNTLLEILSGTGFLGFGIFAALIISIMRNTFVFDKRVVLAEMPGMEEYLDYSRALRLSIVVFFVGSMFVTSLFQDLFWCLMALSVAMENVSRWAQKDLQEEGGF